MRRAPVSVVLSAIILLIAISSVSGIGLAMLNPAPPCPHDHAAGLEAFDHDIGTSHSELEGSQPVEPFPAPMVTVPSAPRSLTATPGNTQISLSWLVPSSDHGGAITNYTIYRSTTTGTETFLIKIGNVLNYTDSGLTNGQIYFYTVAAVNVAGESAWSNEASATPVNVPSTPQGLTAVPGNAQVALSWTAPSSDGGSAITNYTIYRGTTSGGEAAIKTVGNVLGYTDTGLTNGQTYYYKVSAVNVHGESLLSDEASAKPVTVPTAPQTLTATPGDASMTLDWAAPSSDGGSAITNYTIYRGTTTGGESLLDTVGDVLSYLDSGLTNGQDYYYKVAAVNTVGEGPMSNEASGTPAAVPSAPQGLTATPGNAQVSLSWTAPSDDGGSAITNYTIYRGTTSGGETLLRTIGNVLSYLDTGLTNGQTYYYKVSAVNGVGEGARSNEASAKPITVPGAPVLSSATPGDGQVSLAWAAPASDGGSAITGYKVLRGTAPGGEALLISLGNVLSYTDTGLTNGQIYYYQVRAVNAAGEGGLSNELGSTPAALPGAPQDLQATPGNALVYLAWSAPDDDGGSPVLGYHVYRGNDSGDESLLVAIGDVLSYTDSGLINGQTYYYKVSAVNGVGEGAMSEEASAKPTTVPTAPELGSATPGDGQVSLAWTAPSDDGGSPITNYSIYRGTDPGNETFLIMVGDVLSYNDTGLSNGQTYYYMVVAINAEGEGPKSNELSATPFTVPSAPQGLTATPGNAQATLTWTAPSSDGGDPISNYTIYRGTVPGNETFLTMVGDVLNYTDAGLTNGQTYYYIVKAVNGAGEGLPSDEANATPATVPSAPQTFGAVSGNAQIALTWSAPSSDGGSPITNYTIYRGTVSGNETFLVILADILSYTDTGLTNGQTYYYLVKAMNAMGEGAPSEEESATPMTMPSAPTLAAEPGNGQVVLTWSAPSDDGGSAITSYKLYRGTTAGGEVWLLTLGNVLTYTNTGLTNGQTYYYRVSAVNSAGEGPASGEASSTPVTVPSAPRGLAAAPGNLAIGLNWTAPSYCGPGTLTYHLLRDGVEIWNGTGTSHLDSPLAKGQSHSYKVSASNSVGKGASCTEVLAASVGVPDAPWALRAEPGCEQITLSWHAVNYTGPGVLSYHLFCDGVQVWGGTATSYIDTMLVNGRTYDYEVAASNDLGWSANSTSRRAIPQGPPTAPLGLHARPGVGYVELNWTAPSYAGPGVLMYYLFRDGVLIWSGAGLGYEDNGANETSHSYVVKASNSLGQGPYSSSVDAIPLKAESLSTPMAAIAIVGVIAIGLILAAAAVYRSSRSKKKVAADLHNREMICPRCGVTMPMDTEVCSNCGLKGVAHMSIEEPSKDRSL